MNNSDFHEMLAIFDDRTLRDTGLTAIDVHQERIARSFAGRLFGAHATVSQMLGSSVSRTYSLLCELEREKILNSDRLPGDYPRRRVYFLAVPSEDAYRLQLEKESAKRYPPTMRIDQSIMSWSDAMRFSAMICIPTIVIALAVKFMIGY